VDRAGSCADGGAPRDVDEPGHAAGLVRRTGRGRRGAGRQGSFWMIASARPAWPPKETT
jgi:hypothetical protein